MTRETFQDAALTLELSEEAAAVRVAWSGRSMARTPGKFILPVILKAIELSRASQKRLELDFQQIDYMNSSTITPIIRVLEQAGRGADPVRILYNKGRRWQELSFSALAVFQTADGRIEILGV